MSEQINQLIATLSQSPQPSQKVKSPRVLFMAWLVGACLYGALLSVGHFHYRPDLAIKLAQPLFAAEIVSLAILAVSSLLSAVLLSYPDMAQNRRFVFAPLVAMAVFILVLLLEWLADSPSAPPPDHAMECCGAITLFAAPLAFLVLMAIRRMASTHPGLAGGCALLASFSVSALALRLAEQTDSMTHLVEWHYAPMIVFALFGLWLGRKILKW